RTRFEDNGVARGGGQPRRPLCEAGPCECSFQLFACRPHRIALFTRRKCIDDAVCLPSDGGGHAAECPLLAHHQSTCRGLLSGANRTTLLRLSSSPFDEVDGAHSAASKCHRVVVSKRNHIEGSRPWARLSRSGSILRSWCFRFTASMQKARW